MSDDITGRAAEAIRAELKGEFPKIALVLGSGLGPYADTLSQLKPRVMVQGNPLQLAQSSVVAQIRAALLAAVRSAVLWRQLGGSYWDFVLRRGAMSRIARELLEQR